MYRAARSDIIVCYFFIIFFELNKLLVKYRQLDHNNVQYQFNKLGWPPLSKNGGSTQPEVGVKSRGRERRGCWTALDGHPTEVAASLLYCS
jgi:hypothetical protein